MLFVVGFGVGVVTGWAWGWHSYRRALNQAITSGTITLYGPRE